MLSEPLHLHLAHVGPDRASAQRAYDVGLLLGAVGGLNRNALNQRPAGILVASSTRLGDVSLGKVVVRGHG